MNCYGSARLILLQMKFFLNQHVTKWMWASKDMESYSAFTYLCHFVTHAALGSWKLSQICRASPTSQSMALFLYFVYFFSINGHQMVELVNSGASILVFSKMYVYIKTQQFSAQPWPFHILSQCSAGPPVACRKVLRQGAARLCLSGRTAHGAPSSAVVSDFMEKLAQDGAPVR